MNKFRTVSSVVLSNTKILNSSIPFSATRKLSEDGTSKMSEETPRISLEKSVNQVTLLGRVGINPQLRGTESKPVVVFTLATNTNYRYDTGEIQQKTDWHRISVFKPSLRDIVLEHLKKGTRVYIEGRILYGEFSDSNGVLHNTTSIVPNELIFLGNSQRAMEEREEEIDP